MKIDRVEIREIRMRLREPFEISTGVSFDRRVLLVALHSEGITAWGECVAGETPAYSYETPDTAWSILTGLILPRVAGAVMETAADLLPVFEGIRGHPMAKAAVEMAAWDLEAKANGRSLASLIGGVRDSVSVGVSSERTFARYLHEDHTVERELLRLCVSVTSALPDAKARHGQGA